MKGNEEKNDPNFERFQIIQEWCIKNFPSISSYIKVTIKNRKDVQDSAKADLLFKDERKDAHSQLKYELMVYEKKIKSIISAYTNNLNNLVSQPILSLGKLYYQHQKMNMNLHKLLFSRQLIHKLKIKILTLKIDTLISIADKISKANEIIDKSYDDIIIKIDKHFFEMESSIKLQIVKQRNPDLSSIRSSILNESSATSSTISDQLVDSSPFTSTNSFLNPNNPQSKLIYLDSSIVPTTDSLSTEANDTTINQFELLMVRLISYSNHLSIKINNYPKPLWAKDYTQFIFKSVNSSLSRFDNDLSYLLPQECELSINHAIFGNVVKSTEPIDVILRSFTKISPRAFMIELMGMCYKLLPQKLIKTFTPEELSISLTFMFRILFDRIYEKNFESEKNSISEGEKRLKEMIANYDEKRKKYLQMQKLPMSALVWPKEYIPSRPFIVSHWDLSSLDDKDENESKKSKITDSNLINNNNSNTEDTNNNNETAEINSTNSKGDSKDLNKSNEESNASNNNDNVENNHVNNNNSDVTVNNNKKTNRRNNDETDSKYGFDDSFCSDMPIRQFFRTDYYYSPAVEFLELGNFCTNPIDTLYYIHKCLICVQKAAIIHSINKHKNRVATPNELNQVICFDDLFSLTLGVFLASDVPDIFAMNWFVQNYSPRNELSPPLEYAKANLEGLTQHIASVNLNDNEAK